MAIRYLSGINVDSNTLFVDDANNRVGIGTASPTSSGLGSSPALLNIYRASGNAGLTLTIGSDAWDIGNVGGNGLWFLYNNSTKAVITNAGNVGIGTTSPSYKLDVNGQGFFTSGIITNTAVAIKLKQAAGTLNDATEFRTGGGEFKIYSGRDAGAHQAFVFATGDNYTSGSERMRITDAGQVAIGRTTPYAIGGTAKLSVEGLFAIGAGTTDLAYFRKFGAGNLQIQTYNNGNVGELQLQPYGGDVGIGTTSPSYKLDVAGDLGLLEIYALITERLIIY